MNLAEVYERYEGYVYGALHKHDVWRDDIPDLAGEVWLRIARNWNHYEYRSEPQLRSYLSRCIQSVLLDYWRKRRAMYSLEEAYSVQAPLASPETRLDLQTAIRLLKDPQREALRLAVEGWPPAEAAVKMGVRPVYYRVLVWRARQALKAAA